MATNPSDPSAHRARHPSIAQLVAQHGWAIQYVGYGACSGPGCCCSRSSAPWAYTIGLTDMGQPELVAMGGCIDCLHPMFHAVVDQRARGALSLDPGWFATSDAFAQLFPVPDEWLVADWARMAAWCSHHLTGAESLQLPTVQQIVWPCSEGHFPGNVMCTAPWSEAQPILADDPFVYPPVGVGSGPPRRRPTSRRRR